MLFDRLVLGRKHAIRRLDRLRCLPVPGRSLHRPLHRGFRHGLNYDFRSRRISRYLLLAVHPFVSLMRLLVGQMPNSIGEP